ncbi:hypothetical protein [Candidatus Protochlamydia sp. W-9]|uniref:hypothetical protein n=1 Tax=Candidatus Protochlamydia sp. W-9 TaxID=1785087 RepID=UPI00096AA41F|nr:hypothetical protein [Candidatus Protochlamydia sp. W-9]
MNSLFQIEIPKRNGLCSGHAERLQAGMEYYSLIVEGEDHQVIRQDFCAACWPHAIKSELFLKKRGFWKSKIEHKKNEVPSLRFERALHLLKELLEQPSQNEEEIFILSVFLSHSKKLILRQEFEKEGSQWGLYEIAHQDEFLTIKIFPLTTLETEKVQKRLAEKLGDGQKIKSQHL